MQAVSDAFLEQLRESHVVVVEANLLPAGGGDPVPVEVTGGEVRADRTSQVRRTLSAPLAATTARELQLADLPFGGYLEVRRGIRFGDGTTELVDLGLFRVDGVGSSEPGGRAELELSDRMAQVRDEPLLALFAAGGVIASTRIVELVHEVFPGLTTHVSTVGEAVLDDVTFTGDRARAIAELAASIGADAYFDAQGELVVEPSPSLDSPPVWTVDAGVRGVLIGQSDALDRAGAANGVLVRGQANAESPPLEVLVTDDDPASRTFYGGPFGKVVHVIESAAVQDVAQATALAERELARRLGLTRTLSLTSAPNPALEPGDVVEVVLADGTVELHVLDRVSVPLTSTGAVSLETRSTLVVDAPVAVAAGAAAWRELRGARAVA